MSHSLARFSWRPAGDQGSCSQRKEQPQGLLVGMAMEASGDWGSLGWEDPLEEGMETHSSILDWRTSWTEEPGGLLSIGSQTVGHDSSDLARTHTPR